MKKKIALISEHASPLSTLGGVDNGGQNVYIAEVSKQLVKMGYHVDVYTRKDDHKLKTVVEWLPNLRVIHIDAGPPEVIEKEKILPFMDQFAEEMIRFIRDNGLNYYMVHANFFMSGYVANKLQSALNLPFVITFHALGLVRLAHQKEMDKFPKERIAIEKLVVKNANAIIAECPQDRADLIHYYTADAEKIHIVPCGCNPEDFYPVNRQEARKVAGVGEDDFVLLQLGRMVPRKGIENVIRAAALVKEKIQNLRVLIVGGESDEADEIVTPEIGRLKGIAAQLGITGNIIFTGRKNRDELKYYYAASDVFITTPWYEPFGITPLEAMACGIPVVGAKVGGIKYSVKHGETGFLVPPKDPVELQNAILHLSENPELKETMSRKAIRRIQEYFTWEKVSRQLEYVYHLAKREEEAVYSKVIPIYQQKTIVRSLDPLLPLTNEE